MNADLAGLTAAELDARMAAIDAAALHARESEVYDQDALCDGEAAVRETAERCRQHRGGARLWSD